MSTLQQRIAKQEAELARLKRPTMTADDLLKLLAQKHADDVFVPECKDGPTQTTSHRRLDAWVLLRTWSPITTIGYEIKVARGDWLGDKKIVDYLPMCHYLNVVAPVGIVNLAELPAGVGLLEPAGSGTGQRLLTRRKAVWRDIQLPGELLVYVLMCRVVISRERAYEQSTDWRVKHLRQWVDGERENHQLSYAVSAKIRERFDEQRRQLAKMETRCQELESVKRRIGELGFDVERHVDTWSVRRKVEQLAGAIDPLGLLDMLEHAQNAIQTARKAVEALKV